MAINNVLLKIASYTYGGLTLAVAYLSAVTDAAFWRAKSHQEVEQDKRAINELWSLSQASSLHTHGFLTLQSGLQLHFLRSPQDESSVKPRTLIVFLHGFPDSCYIFTSFLKSSDLHEAGAICVALDLPGYGGSDGLSEYSASKVLNAISEGIAVLKAKHSSTSSSATTGSEDASGDIRCVLVGHDWGGVVAARIAAETVGLVDRVVVLNSAYPAHAKANLQARLSASREPLSQWRAAPWRLSALSAAYEPLAPVVAQLGKSSYIFMFNLPLPLAKWLPSLVSHLLRWVILKGHYRVHGTAPSPRSFATSMASSLGPSVHECASRLPDGTTYGSSVLAQSQTHPAGDWDERIRVYREGLATGEWKPNDVTVRYFAGYDDKTGPLGRFRCPVIYIFGLKDLALDPRITLHGIEQYFAETRHGDHAQQSYVVRLKDCGHWCMLERPAGEVLKTTLSWMMWCLDAGAQPGSVAKDLKSLLSTFVESGQAEVTTR